jgi:hypothetical protein
MGQVPEFTPFYQILLDLGQSQPRSPSGDRRVSLTLRACDRYADFTESYGF